VEVVVRAEEAATRAVEVAVRAGEAAAGLVGELPFSLFYLYLH
jgi:hypothetical protein